MEAIEIKAVGKELRTDSRLLAGFLDHRHRTILENIDRYQGELLELGRLPFETEKGKPLEHGGFAKASRFALLNEDQCYFVLTLMRNNPRVVAAKLALVKAFRDARAELALRDLARLEGKQIRKLETQAIRQLVEYANGQGSKSAEMYYVNITRMANRLVGISGPRDVLGADQIKRVSVVESVVDLAIRDGIKAKLHYKDIYRLAECRARMVMPALSDGQG